MRKYLMATPIVAALLLGGCTTTGTTPGTNFLEQVRIAAVAVCGFEPALDVVAAIVATGNPGCLLQLINGAKKIGLPLRVVHPVTLLAEAYRRAE